LEKIKDFETRLREGGKITEIQRDIEGIESGADALSLGIVGHREKPLMMFGCLKKRIL
jgi:hypothetical protein